MSRLYRKEVIVSEDAKKELTVLTNIYRDGPVREYRMNNDIEEACNFWINLMFENGINYVTLKPNDIEFK